MAGNDGIYPVGKIILELHPTGEAGQYKIEISHRGIDGGWATVFAALLEGLGLAVNQLTQQPVGNSPVFQAMCGVFRAFLHGLLQSQAVAPRIARVQELPPTMPPVKEWFKN